MQIESVTRNGLCISCGICASVCPKECITSEYKNGSYLPTIDESKCINCGLCHRLCPGKGVDYLKMYEMLESPIPNDIMIGNFRECLTVQAKDKNILHKSASGGVVTTLVSQLLNDEIYDSAFLIDTYNHDQETFSQRYSKDMDLNNTLKSRYIAVNHSHAVKYILKNRTERIILIGTPCFIQGMIQIINHYKLDRSNYLLLGLFCDKNFSYNMWHYFKSVFTNNELEHLYFRSKDNDDWPGNVILENKKTKWLLPAKIRMLMKEYFCLERCLYCLDKLNQFSDLSCGDNYTKGKYKSTKAGSSNVIVRTNLGNEIMQRYRSKFNINSILVEEVTDSQHMDARKDNFVYSVYKSAKIGYTFNNLPPEIACDICEQAEI